MSVHLKIEEGPEGLVPTLSKRDGDGKPIGQPSVGIVAGTAEAKRRETLAQLLGLKVYGLIDKTKSAADPKKPPKAVTDTGDGDGRSNAAKKERPPWLVPGIGKSL